ncbi:transposase [Vibrio cholerae]|uniref:transposase n=1 Tax=Vibrio cholerae TaxID=666 RepID=UPI0035317080
MSAFKPSDVRRSFSPEFKWQVVQESKARALSASALARKYDVNTNQLFRWVREAQLGKALWVRRAQGELPILAEPNPFLPVCVQAAEAPPTVHQSAITVSFRTGHQLVLHQATPDMLRQLVAALSC